MPNKHFSIIVTFCNYTFIKDLQINHFMEILIHTYVCPQEIKKSNFSKLFFCPAILPASMAKMSKSL